MALQHNVYNPTDFTTCWQHNDHIRNAKLDKEGMFGYRYEAAEDAYCANARAECRALWEIQRKKIQQSVSNPMPCTHPRAKICLNDRCGREVSWEWGDGKNWCCGDRCVETLAGPDATHRMKMNCINMELQRYWENLERELDGIAALEAVSTPTASPVVFSFDSPTSVGDIEEEGMFSMEDIMPLDLHEIDLYCRESLSSEIIEAGCDDLLLE